jgi:homoserine O-acetyltransferase/O-succinyltransferase
MIDAIQQDPEWKNGEYTTQPRVGLIGAANIFTLANAAPRADQKRLSTREAADQEVETRAATFASTHDANDLLYAFRASFDYDASPDLEKITAPFVLVNGADDFINPPELGIEEREMKRVKRGRFILVPATDTSHGHGLHRWATVWQADLKKLLDATARK